MQIKSLRTKSYRSWKIDDRAIPKIVKERENKIKRMMISKEPTMCNFYQRDIQTKSNLYDNSFVLS